MELINLTDAELLASLSRQVAKEREDTSLVVAHLAELERRGLTKNLSYPNLFDYCTKELGYSEASAYHRIRAARAVRKKPELLDMLRNGQLHLRSLVLLHPHLESEAADNLIEKAKGKSRRELETLLGPAAPAAHFKERIRVVNHRPAPAIEDLPLFAATKVIEAEKKAAVPEAIIKIEFSASLAFEDLLSRARGLLRAKIPSGALAEVFEEALNAVIRERDPDHWQEPRRSQSRTRKVPRWIKKRVWKRDAGQCSFVGPNGRCQRRDGLEYDHVLPWARGGSSNDPGNVRLLCRGHNLQAAAEAGLGRPEG